MTPVPARLRLERLDARCVWSAGMTTAAETTAAVADEPDHGDVSDPAAGGSIVSNSFDYAAPPALSSVPPPPPIRTPVISGSLGSGSALYRLVPDGRVSGPVFRPKTDFYFDPNTGQPGSPDQPPAPVAAVLAEVRAAVHADWAAPVPLVAAEPTVSPAAPNPEPSEDTAPGAAAVEQPQEPDEPERRPERATASPSEAFDTDRKTRPEPARITERTAPRPLESDGTHEPVSRQATEYQGDDFETDGALSPATHSGIQAEYEATDAPSAQVPPKTDDEQLEGDWVPAVRWAVWAAIGGLTARRLHGVVATRVRRSPDPVPPTASY